MSTPSTLFSDFHDDVVTRATYLKCALQKKFELGRNRWSQKKQSDTHFWPPTKLFSINLVSVNFFISSKIVQEKNFCSRFNRPIFDILSTGLKFNLCKYTKLWWPGYPLFILLFCSSLRQTTHLSTVELFCETDLYFSAQLFSIWFFLALPFFFLLCSLSRKAKGRKVTTIRRKNSRPTTTMNFLSTEITRIVKTMMKIGVKTRMPMLWPNVYSMLSTGVNRLMANDDLEKTPDCIILTDSRKIRFDYQTADWIVNNRVLKFRRITQRNFLWETSASLVYLCFYPNRKLIKETNFVTIFLPLSTKVLKSCGFCHKSVVARLRVDIGIIDSSKWQSVKIFFL